MRTGCCRCPLVRERDEVLLDDVLITYTLGLADGDCPCKNMSTTTSDQRVAAPVRAMRTAHDRPADVRPCGRGTSEHECDSTDVGVLHTVQAARRVGPSSGRTLSLCVRAFTIHRSVGRSTGDGAVRRDCALTLSMRPRRVEMPVTHLNNLVIAQRPQKIPLLW